MRKRVLVVGSGGREHALAWKLSQSPDVDTVWAAPERFATSVAGRMPTAYELEWRAEGRPMRFFRYRRV